MLIIVMALSFWGVSLLGMAHGKDNVSAPALLTMTEAAIESQNQSEINGKSKKFLVFFAAKEVEKEEGCCCFSNSFVDKLVSMTGYAGLADCFFTENKKTVKQD